MALPFEDQHMSELPNNRKWRGSWPIIVAVLLPVLYVFGMGPLWKCAVESESDLPARTVTIMWAPIECVLEKVPVSVKLAYFSYIEWCCN